MFGDFEGETTSNGQRYSIYLSTIYLPDTLGNSWWGCAPRFSKSWPYFRQQNVIFHTLLYTGGLIVSHLQLLFVVVVVLTNHNKPRWLTCDPTWRACGEYITWCRSSGISNHKDNTNRLNMAEGYANSSYKWPNMNWAAADLSKEWERFYQHCEYATSWVLLAIKAEKFIWLSPGKLFK